MKINFSKLNTKELGALAQNVIESTRASEQMEAKTHLFFTRLDQSFIPYYATLGKQSFSGKGQSVAKADEERDKIFIDLKIFIEAYARVETLPYHTDAAALLEVIKTLGSRLNRLSYAEQTIQLSKLIDAFSTPEHSDRLRKIGMEPTFRNLMTAHFHFKQIYDEQAQANSKLRESKPASILRKELEQDLRRFLDLVTLMHQAGQWTELYLKINELVKGIK